MKNLFLLLSCGLILWACQSEDPDAWKAKDLLPYNIPVTIMAPDSVDVQANDIVGSMRDVTLKGDDNYYIQIFASDAQTTDIAKVKADQLAEVKNNRFFSRIVSEEEGGFIYENKIDPENPNYGFRYIVIRGDREYIFQPGMSAMFSLEEAQRLYEAVKPVK